MDNNLYDLKVINSLIEQMHMAKHQLINQGFIAKVDEDKQGKLVVYIKEGDHFERKTTLTPKRGVSTLCSRALLNA